MVPPHKPSSVPGALQNCIPLASVMDVIAKPPGSAPPFTLYKPAPRLVPLPRRHTLRVKHPDCLHADTFADLTDDNLQVRGLPVDFSSVRTSTTPPVDTLSVPRHQPIPRTRAR
jgi:hypothetical protein